MIENIIAAVNWFFSLQTDATTLPWFEANKYTMGAIFGGPYLIYRWYRSNLSRIRLAEREFDEKEKEKEAES